MSEYHQVSLHGQPFSSVKDAPGAVLTAIKEAGIPGVEAWGNLGGCHDVVLIKADAQQLAELRQKLEDKLGDNLHITPVEGPVVFHYTRIGIIPYEVHQGPVVEHNGRSASEYSPEELVERSRAPAPEKTPARPGLLRRIGTRIGLC